MGFEVVGLRISGDSISKGSWEIFPIRAFVFSNCKRLALPLLVPGVFADDADDIFALHDAAAFAEAFDGGSDFHGLNLGWNLEDKKSR